MDEQHTAIWKKHSFLVEREKFLKNVAAAKNTREESFILTVQLRSLFEKIQFSKADSRSLKVKLDRTAKKNGITTNSIQTEKPIPGSQEE